MTREEKIAAIYKEMANKELTFGCKVKINKGIYEIINRKNGGFLSSYKGKYGDIHNTIVIEDGVNSRCYSIQKIIGHPVMIGDVLDWIEPYGGVFAQSVNLDIERTRKGTLLLSVRKQKRKPIDDQSDECIDYVYSFIQKY